MESSSSPPTAAARRTPPDAAEVRLRWQTVESVLEQCQRMLEMLHDSDLILCAPEEAAEAAPQEDEKIRSPGNGEAQPASTATDADYEMDELCDLLKSKIESAEFLHKIDGIQKSVYQNGTVEEAKSWDIIDAAYLWEDKHVSVDDESEDGYVLVKQDDVVDGIACFMASYLLSLKQTKELTPNQLQKVYCHYISLMCHTALHKTFSAQKKKSKLGKAWDGTKVIYNLASWSATAVGVYQNPAIVKAATAALRTSCHVISKFL